MEIAHIGFIFLLSGFVQTVLGFGLGLVSLPLLLQAEYPLPESIFLLTVSSCTQTYIVSFKLRKHIPWKDVITAVLFRMGAIYLGVEFLHYISTDHTNHAKQFFGIVLLILVTLKFKKLSKEIKRMPRAWSYFAFILSGFMAGGFGIGGPPLVLWVNSTGWPQQKIRAFLLAVFALSLPASIAMLLNKFPDEIARSYHLCFYAVPFMFLGIFWGLKLGEKISTRLFIKITLIFLALISLNFILGPYLSF